MKLEGDLEIMCAHRTNIRRQNIKENTAPPLARPVHVYLLRYTDKQYILCNAASALKDNASWRQISTSLTTCRRK